MEPIVSKKDLFRKYAKILHVEDSNQQPARLSYPPENLTPKKTNQPTFAEKYIQSRQPKTALQSPNSLVSSSMGFKFPVARMRSSSKRANISLNNSLSPKLVASSSEQQFTISSYLTESKEKEGLRATPTRSSSKTDWSELRGTRAIELRGSRETLTLGNSAILKSRKAYHPYGEKKITLETLYTEAKDFSEELKNIVAQEHEETVKLTMKLLNAKEFIKIQKSRLNNVIKVVEKGFVQKIAQENKVKQETWNLVLAEFNGIKATYEDFLLAFEDALDKVSKGKKKIDDSMRPWKALKLLIEYSYLYRDMKSNTGSESQEKLESLLKKIHEFKIEYKVSREFKQEILEYYEMMETHIKDLNKRLDEEKEQANFVGNQRERLEKEQKEIEKKTEKLKVEMFDIIQDLKKEKIQGYHHSPTSLQEKFMQNKAEHIQAELDKALSDNIQLQRELKDNRQEFRRLASKNERYVKSSKDKGIMVDLYSIESQELRPVKILSYVCDLELCKDGSIFPKEYMNSILNMIYTDKMITDLCDDNERRPRRTLKAFLPEWFLKRFGIYSIGEIVLRDFMFNINSTASNDKYKIFKHLLGTEINNPVDNFKFMLGGHSHQSEKLKLKKIAFSTAEMMRQFFRIVNCIKNFWQLESNTPLPPHNYGPFLPSTRDLVSSESVKHILKTIFNEEKVSEDDGKDYEEYLYLIQRNESYDRNAQVKSGANEAGDSTNRNIRFDLLLKFLMEIVLEKHIESLEKYYTSFRTRSSSIKGNISYEEFVSSVNFINPEATQAWKDHSFGQFMMEYSAQKVPLIKLMENFVKCYFQEDQAKEFYQKVQTEKLKKRDTRSLKLEKGNSKTSQASKALQQTIYTKPRLLQSPKEAFNLGDSGLNEEGYELYDAISSLIVLQETYYMFEEKIISATKLVDGLMNTHEDFERNLNLLPKRISKLEKLDSLMVFGKEELVDFIESLWTKFRNILALTFRNQ